MAKPKVALLLNKSSRARVLSQKELMRLRTFARASYVETDQLDTETTLKLIKDSDAAIASWGTHPFTEEVLNAAPNLKFVAYAAGSVKPVVTDEFWRRNIKITSTASSIAISVAQYTLGLIITGLSRVYWTSRRTAKGDWAAKDEKAMVKGMHGITVGLVGAGFVGRQVVELLKPFEIEVMLYDPYLSKAEAEKLGVRKTGLKILMKHSDAVSLHAPSLPETNHMINDEMLRRMKPGALLINTARGTLIDEKALIKVLREGRINAILDVTDPEPPAKSNPLLKMDNVIVTPHVAGMGSNLRQGEYAVTEIERFFNRKKPMYEVTQDMLARMA